MSSSSSRREERGDSSGPRRSRKAYHDDTYRERERTPRSYGHQPIGFTSSENLEEGMAKIQVGGEDFQSEEIVEVTQPIAHEMNSGRGSEQPKYWSEWSKWKWQPRDSSGYWWRSRTDEHGELDYAYGNETSDSPSQNYAATGSISTQDHSIQTPLSQNEEPNSQTEVINPKFSSNFMYENSQTTTASFTPNTDSNYSNYSTLVAKSSYSLQAQQTTGPSTDIASPGEYRVNTSSGSDYSQYQGRTSEYSTRKSQYKEESDTAPDEKTSAAKLPSQLPPIFIDPPNCGCDSENNLCGVVIFPSKPPQPSDGKISSKKQSGSSKGDSSKSKGSRSKTTGSSGSTSGAGRLSARGPDGKNCGPIVMPGITPSPRPETPSNSASRKIWDTYRRQSADWEKEYETWKHISCPCGRGYFNYDGLWISGGDVRSGRRSPNPLWKATGGRAPPAPLKEKYKLILHERSERSESPQFRY